MSGFPSPYQTTIIANVGWRGSFQGSSSPFDCTSWRSTPGHSNVRFVTAPLSELPIPSSLPFSAIEVRGVDPKTSFRLTVDVIAELTKHRFPKVNQANDVVGYVETLIESVRNIHQQIAEGKNPEESVLCELTRVGVQTSLEAAAKGIIMAGLPLYLSEVVALPPLAVTVPAVVAAFPEAMAAATQLGEAGGAKAEERCQAYLQVFRALTQRGKQ